MEVMFSLYFSGCVMDSPAALSEAKCMTASNRFSEKRLFSGFSFKRDPSMNFA